MKNEARIIEVLKDLCLFSEKLLKIRTKSGEIKPFIFNRSQLFLHNKLEEQLKEKGLVRAIILKGRQGGCSTYVQARYFHKVSTQRGKKAFILTHEAEATKGLFEMTKRYYDLMEPGILPEPDTSSAKNLNFKALNSGYGVGTAGNKAVGRSQTIQLMHACLDENTLIYDPILKIAREISSFKVGDSVLTHNLNIAPISHISCYKKKCINVLLRTMTAYPLIATPEHKFLTKQGWKNLSELAINDLIGFPVFNIEKSIKNWVLPNNNIRLDGGGRHFKAPSLIALTYEFGKIIGLYLAEGHAKKQHKYPLNMCSISFIVHRKEKDRTVDWLKPFQKYFSSISATDRKESLASIVIVYGSQFANLINKMCGRTTGKHFPKDWHLMGKDFCEGMIHGYIAGDGGSYEKTRRVTVSSICMPLILDIRNLCASVGYGWGSIAFKESAVRHARNEKKQYSYSLCGEGAAILACRLNKPTPLRRRSVKNGSHPNTAKTTEISGGYAWLRVREIKEDIERTVYDFEVDHNDHSYCTIHGASHNSEVGYYPHADEHAKGILQAVSNEPGTEIIMESTANGLGNYFYNMWQSAVNGDSDFQAIFLPWYWQMEYTAQKRESDGELTDEEQDFLTLHSENGLTLEHLYWRRRKLHEFSNDYLTANEQFKVEYPMTAMDAFRNPVSDRFIKAHLVIQARKNIVDSESPLIIGVDPAISDNDRTAIIRRKGRLAYNLETFFNYKPMEIVGLIRKIIENERPTKVCIDSIGIGSGICDRLLELGYGGVIEPVCVSRTANDKIKFKNQRAELWHDMREWLSQEMSVQIPDSDELMGDLTCLGYKYDSSARLQIESKDDLKSRGIKSPDCADALSLTFTMGDYMNNSSYKTNFMPKKSKGMFT